MSERTVPKLPKWPFFLGDILLVTLAYLILGAAYAHGKWPMNTWQNLWCVLSLSLGCVLGVLPFLLEYRAAMKLTEADRLTNAVLQIENLEIIGRQITNATANWQTAHEHSIQAVETAREIAEGNAAEARVAETVANGYSFQGQLVRPALVTLQPGESPESSTPDSFPASAGDEDRAQSSTAEENSSPTPPGTETEGEVSASPPPTGN